MECIDDDKDLPLCANVQEILVAHYQLSLLCDFEKKSLTGSVTLSLNPQADPLNCIFCKHTFSSNRKPFQVILDSQDIDVQNVLELDKSSTISDFVEENNYQNRLSFSVDKWSLRIWKNDVFCQHQFPSVVKIFYSTSASGKSLLWVQDQNGRPSVYTYGAWINNRSLLPCQEPPIAMATWEANILVPWPSIVLTSGDIAMPPYRHDNSLKRYSFCTKSVLPISTFALAIGYWEVIQLSSPLKPDCRIIAPSCLIERASNEFSVYLPKCLQAAEMYLGAYPFPRLDVLVVPQGFGSMGMASPNLIFVSQTLLPGDGSLCSRLSHEVAHGWFGLLIGARDWTEEWLSEGFATFLEDLFHAHSLQLSTEECTERGELRAWLRWRTLEAEVEQSKPELQTLRPTKGNPLHSTVNGSSVTVVKNGINPEKGFLQVHYIKGYFLLRFLSQAVGDIKFLEFLKHFVTEFQGKLIESKEFLDAYFCYFPNTLTTENNSESVFSKWLDTPGLPTEGQTLQPSVTNKLYKEAIEEAQIWKTLIKKCVGRKRRKNVNFQLPNKKKLKISEQVLIFLELLIEEESIPVPLLKSLNLLYSLDSANAEIRHRWCELVVQHGVKESYKDVKTFLTKDLAMGVYLFNELLLSGDSIQVALGKECYSLVSQHLEPNFETAIQGMLETQQSLAL